MRRLFFVLLFFLLLGGTAQAAMLAGDWYYQPGGSEFSEAQRDDRLASAAALDTSWRPMLSRVPAHDAEARVLWVTTTLLPRGDADTLLFSTTGESVRVYLGKEEIFASGEMVRTFSGGGTSWYFVHLPATVTPEPLTFAFYSDFPEQLGTVNYLMVGTEKEAVAQIFYMDTSLVLSLPVSAAMMLIVVFFYYREPTGRRLYRALFAFLLTFFLWGIAGLGGKYFFLPNTIFWWYALSTLAYFLPITANVIIYEVLRGPARRRVGWIIGAYVLLFVAALVLEALGLHGFRGLMKVFYLMLAVLEPLAFYWTLREARGGSCYARSILIPIVLFTVLGVIDGANSYGHFLPSTAFLSPFGIYGIAVFLMTILRQMVRREQRLGEEADVLRGAIAAAQQSEAYDPLTRCFSRKMYQPMLMSAMETARGLRAPLSVIMLDIDHFKRFNDIYGHEAGDEVLAGFAAAVRRVLPEALTFIRWGGEEFILLAPGYTLHEAEALAERIVHAIANLRLHAEPITASAGVATWHGSRESGEALFARVDAALYEAKKGGRNRVVTEK